MMTKDTHDIAFVLSGELRAFAVPEVHGSIRANVVDALCPLSSKLAACTSDVFLCPSPDRCPPYSYYSRSSVQLRSAGSTSRSRLAMVIRRFAGGNLSLPNSTLLGCANLNALLPACSSDASALDECSTAWAAVKERCAEAIRSAGTQSAAARLLAEVVSPSNASTWGNVGSLNSWRCYRRVVEYEQRSRSGVRYDWIVRMRFDVAFFQPLPTIFEFASRGPAVYVADNHEKTFADHFGVVAREHADAYFGSSRMRCCTSLNRCLTRIVGTYFLPHNPEQNLQASLWQQRVPVRFGYYPWILVRQIGAGGDVAANCYVHKDCCAPHGKQRAFGSSCWPPCPPVGQRLERCNALFGTTRTCTDLPGAAPAGIDVRTRTQVAGKDFNKVNLCNLIPNSKHHTNKTQSLNRVV